MRPPPSSSLLSSLPPSRSRLVCILAHVDHGKTSLSDSLLASNNLLHPAMAGTLRYLDSRPDEQARGITMKSSSISLLHIPSSSPHSPSSAESCSPTATAPEGAVVVNLIDSPGHIDFCSEVSTAVRLSDGALIVVDACEGVCIQTYAVLRQAWREKLATILFINKIDRLILELGMDAQEAYSRLERIVRDVNNIVSGFQSEDFLSQADAFMAHIQSVEDTGEAENVAEGVDMPDLDSHEEDAFNPAKGNVIFGCAIDGWGFRPEQFATIYAQRLGCSESALRRALWGNYFYNPKTKKIVGKKAALKNGKPLFVQMVLEPIYKAYAIMEQDEKEAEAGLKHMATKLGIALTDKDFRRAGERAGVQALMRAWLPLARATLDTVVEMVPSPVEAGQIRSDHLMPALEGDVDPAVLAKMERLDRAMRTCDGGEDAPTVAFVSKIFAVPSGVLRAAHAGTGRHATCSDLRTDEEFLGFCRVFSGSLRVGQHVRVLFGNYDPRRASSDGELPAIVEVSGIYLMMGSGLEPLQEARAGAIVAVEGLGAAVLKSATLSSVTECRPISEMVFQAAPLVRVAVEPKDPARLPDLVEGLRLLNRADPFVEIHFQDDGEHVLAAAGEVHLETCIKDLQERFAKMEVEVSAPLVSFKESVRSPEDEDSDAKAERTGGKYEFELASGVATVRVRAMPMHEALARSLADAEDTSRTVLGEESSYSTSSRDDVGETILKSARQMLTERNNAFSNAVVADDKNGEVEETDDDVKLKEMRKLLSDAWALGPKRCGPNILLAHGELPAPASCSGGGDASRLPLCRIIRGRPIAAGLLGLQPAEMVSSIAAVDDGIGDDGKDAALVMAIESAITTGFQLATAAGPLCEEPMWGVAFAVDVLLHTDDVFGSEEHFGPFSGQLIAAMKECCRLAVNAASPRLVEAMYLCEATTTAETLGGTYAVLGRRRARILREEMVEGSGMFCVHAYLPMASSFRFAEEIRKNTSGAASVQLMLSHWERLAVDPYFVPTTFEEREEHGEGGDAGPNVARQLTDAVRRRKGLHVQEKVVEKATKQRTLAKKV